VPGLLQTADYARTLFEAWRSAPDDGELDDLVTARMGRQSIFERPKPPALWVILDEAVLHRCVGSAKIMYDQLAHVVRMSDRVNVTVQVVPGSVGAHVGLLGGFAIASGAFDTLRAEALPRAASRDLIRKVTDERWTE
jgi:hypothetical protein